MECVFIIVSPNVSLFFQQAYILCENVHVFAQNIT